MTQTSRHLARATTVIAASALILAACGSATANKPTSKEVHPHTSTTAVHPRSTSSTTPTNSTATTPTSAPPSTTASVPSGFQPASFTSVSPDQWWVLGLVPCAGGAKSCHVAIAHTVDGGAHFSSISGPPVGDPQVSQIRFANSQDGYAYGDELWQTSDGGRSWSETATSGPISNLEIAGSEALALICPTTVANCRAPELERSSVGSSSWAKVATPVALGYGSEMSVGGPDLYLFPGYSKSKEKPVLLSTNAGASFSERSDPCTPGLGGDIFASAGGAGVVWMVCPSGTLAGVLSSTDSGVTWHRVAGGVTNSFAVSPASATTALGWPGQGDQALEVTFDGASHFATAISSPHRTLFAAYASATRAYAIIGTLNTSNQVSSSTLYESASGGAAGSWKPVPIG